MMDDPIDQSSFKSNVPARFFALDPFVAEDFLFLGAERLVESCFYEAFRGTLKSKLWHEVIIVIVPRVLELNSRQISFA
jgi:hypothetical protein